MTILIQGADYIVRSAERVERDSDLLVEGTRIVGVGTFSPLSDWEVIDATGCAVIPGLINAHTHLYQNFLKGLNDGVPLVEWCDRVLFPAADVIHADHWQAGDQRLGYAWSLVSALEMIQAGITCCINMDMTMDSVFQGWLDIGLRAVGAVTLSDQWLPDTLLRSPEVSREAALGFVRRWHNVPSESPLIQVMLAPSTPFLASADLLTWTARHRDLLDVGLQIHVAETRYEIDYVAREAGTTPLRYLDRFGLVDDRLTAVHCVHMDEGDLDLLQERGAIPIHSPKSNMKLGSGIAPVTEMLRRGMPVALGTDGSASNDLQDMFEEMRFAALLHKVAAQDPSVISAVDVFRMATENGARACCIDAGTLDPGRLADLAIVNLRKPHLLPVHDIVNSLVYCVRAQDVETTIINGRIVMRNRRLLTMEEEQVLTLAEEWGTDLRKRSMESRLYPSNP
jgi:5-methylthioadenosine/S-adenosylhomocysteine deaminase